MLKLIGALLIISATGLAGWSVAREYARRPVELKQFITALQMLETEIIYAATPLPEAFGKIAEQLEPQAASFFRQAAGELASRQGCSAREAWHRALDSYAARSALARGDLSILRGLGGNIGISDRDDQVKHLRLAAEQLKAACAAAESLADKNVKLWHYLGLLGGLLVVLALY